MNLSIFIMIISLPIHNILLPACINDLSPKDISLYPDFLYEIM